MKTILTKLLFILLMCNSLLTITANAQEVRGLYVNYFDLLMADEIANNSTTRQDGLIQYAIDNNINYLVLYNLHNAPIYLNGLTGGGSSPALTNSALLADFIEDAHNNGIKVGASGQSVDFFQHVVTYNTSMPNQRFDVCNLEYEYWTTDGRANLADDFQIVDDHEVVYKFLTDNLPGGCVSRLDQMISTAHNDGMSFEIYLGQRYDWDNTPMPDEIWKDELRLFANKVDVLLLTSYFDAAFQSGVTSYTRDDFHHRFEDLAYDINHNLINRAVTVRPILSSEDTNAPFGCGDLYMGKWLKRNAIRKPYVDYINGFNSEPILTLPGGTEIANCRSNGSLRIDGFQWFDYTEMQPQIFYGNDVLTGNFNTYPQLPVTICQGSSLTLSSGFTYAWDDGTTTRSRMFNTLTNGSPITVYADVTNFFPPSAATNCRNVTKRTDILLVEVVAGTPPSSPTAGSINFSGCVGSAINLTSNVTSDNHWTGPTIDFTSTDQNPVITASTFANSGSYCVSTGSATCKSVPSCTQIIGSPGIFITPSVTIETGSTLQIASSAVGAWPFTYSWSPTGSTTRIISIPTVTAANAGSYTVTITDVVGCSSTATMEVTVEDHTPTITVTTNCNNSTLTAGNISGTFEWSSGQTTSPINVPDGTYTLTQTVNGCEFTSIPVTVVADVTPTVSISANGSPTQFCIGGHVTLTATTNPGCTYQWKKNGSDLTGATNATYDANTTGTYTCVVHNACGFSQPSNSVLVTVLPTPTAVITGTGNSVFCIGGSTLLTASTGTGYSYQWNMNSIPIVGATFNYILAGVVGNYTCTITNTCGPSTSNSISVTSLPNPNAMAYCIPNPVFVGDAINLSATGGTSYSWHGPNNWSSALQNPVIPQALLTDAGTYSVDVTGSNGCTISTSVVVAVDVEYAGLKFDGEKNRCMVPHIAAYDIGMGAFTIEALIEFDPSCHNLFAPIVSNRSGAQGTGFVFGIYNGPNSNLGKLFLSLGGSQYIDAFGPQLNDSKCHCVAVTRDGSGHVLFYVDGIVSQTTVTSTYGITTANKLSFGFDNTSNPMGFKGNIGYVRFWKVARNLNALIRFAKYHMLLPAPTNLIGYWPMDPYDQITGQGQTIFDYSDPLTPTNHGTRGPTTNAEPDEDPKWNTLCIGSFRLGSQQEQNSSLTDNLIITPNPSNGLFSLNYTLIEGDKSQVIFYDLFGKKLNEYILDPRKNKMNLDLSDLPPAVYLYRFLVNGIGKTSGKIIIER